MIEQKAALWFALILQERMLKMSKEIQCVLAGFGGQGVLFAGKVLANAGLIEDCELSWLPSYGPEMRGGTANCSVTLSSNPIGSLLVTSPNVLIAMNQPSYDKFINTVAANGVVVLDSGLVSANDAPTGIEIYKVNASQIAQDEGLNGLTNIILLGKMWAITKFCSRETLDKAIEASVPASKAHLIERNKQAIEIGIKA